jgi:hypothetical protein
MNPLHHRVPVLLTEQQRRSEKYDGTDGGYLQAKP